MDHCIVHHVPDGRGDSYDCTISETVTSMVPLGLKHPAPGIKCMKIIM